VGDPQAEATLEAVQSYSSALQISALADGGLNHSNVLTDILLDLELSAFHLVYKS
jgi:hypothetical protein